MVRYTSLFICIFISGVLFAQQDDQFTHFMHNKMGYNPAFAGELETGTFTALVRQQYLGLEDAPSAQMLAFNMPLSSTGIGLGGQISRSSIGLSEQYTMTGNYAYRLNMGVGGRLGIGVSTSVRLLRVNFDEARPIEAISLDEAIPAGLQSKYVANFGGGLYYSNQQFFVGFSVPRLLENNIDLSDEGMVISREIRHFYLMGGMTLPIDEKVKIQPQALLKFVSGAPFDADVNATLIFNDKVYTGLSYRIGGSSESGIGESASILAAIDVSENWRFGLAYDLVLSEFRSYQNGSIEALIRYAIGGKSQGDTIESPRFFPGMEENQ